VAEENKYKNGASGPSKTIKEKKILNLNLIGHHSLNSIKLLSAFNNHKISFDYSNLSLLQKNL
jgi:hypothetical protein